MPPLIETKKTDMTTSAAAEAEVLAPVEQDKGLTPEDVEKAERAYEQKFLDAIREAEASVEAEQDALRASLEPKEQDEATVVKVQPKREAAPVEIMSEEVAELLVEEPVEVPLISDFKDVVLLDDGRLDMLILHKTYGWIPFTADPEDVEEHGRELHALGLARLANK